MSSQENQTTTPTVDAGVAFMTIAAAGAFALWLGMVLTYDSQHYDPAPAASTSQLSAWSGSAASGLAALVSGALVWLVSRLAAAGAKDDRGAERRRQIQLLACIVLVNTFGCLYLCVGGLVQVFPAALVLFGLPMLVWAMASQFGADKCDAANVQLQASAKPSGMEISREDSPGELSVISLIDGDDATEFASEASQIESLENEARLLAALAEREVPGLRAEPESLGVLYAEDADTNSEDPDTGQTQLVRAQTSQIIDGGVRVESGECLVELADGERQTSIVVQFTSAFEAAPSVDFEIEEEGVRASLVNCTPMGFRTAIKSPSGTKTQFHLGWAATETQSSDATGQPLA